MLRKQVALAICVAAILLHAQRVDLQPPCACASSEAVHLNQRALDFHLARRLDEASRHYERLLREEAPREPSDGEQNILLKFAPRIFAARDEPFDLLDVAAVMHPTAPWIAYHLFWEDDIDFPEDNDPCDHEVIWVRLDPKRERLLGYFTYFHGRVLHAPKEGLEDAAQHNGRPAVEVQWGKHGSMPRGWRHLTITVDNADAEKSYYPTGRPISLEEYNRGTYEKLSTIGRRMVESPLGRSWPARFEGAWDDFVRFDRLVNAQEFLHRARLYGVSCWNNAVLDRQLLTYNFRPKIEWPPQICEDLQQRASK